MIKSFIWTGIFWTLFTITNSITDSILFYQNSPWYDNSDLWHFLKYWWIGFAVLTGVFAIRLWTRIKYNIYHVPYSYLTKLHERKTYRLKVWSIFGFLLLYFLLLRWIIFETLLEKWGKL